MFNRILAGACIYINVLLFACSAIEVDRDSFHIVVQEELLSSKDIYLDQVPVAGSSDSLPNIVIILVDDLGKFDISAYGPEGVSTPAIDRLAAGGIRFSHAYSTSSVCSPSRAGLLTGRYQQRFGFERQPMNRYARNRMEYWIVDHLIDTEPMRLVKPMSNPGKEEIKKQGIPESEILLSEILSKRGYSSGIFGKWHLGFNDPFLPNNRGFEEQYGFYEAFSLYAPENDPEIVNFKHDYFANKHIWRQQRKGNCAIRENNQEISEDKYLTFSIADRACGFMENNRDNPFFLYLPFSAPHTPFQAPREYSNRFNHVEDENKRIYYGMISALDEAIGQVMNKIEELGIAGHTLLFFASDNGGAEYTGATDNGILRAGKFSQFEGGINIPLIMSWKGVLPGGLEYDHAVSLMDVFSTSIEAAGCKLPSGRTIDGINLIPYLVEEKDTVPHEYLFWRTDFNRAARKGEWKLVWNQRDDQVFLYNLNEDPGEELDLSNAHPERVEALKSKILEWESEMMDPMWPGVMEFRNETDGEVSWWAI